MTIKTSLYNGEVELVFESYMHRYTLEGKVIPSVTTILGVVAKPALIPWAANMAASHIQNCLTPGKAYDELEIAAIVNGARKAHYNKKKDAADMGTFIHKWVERYIRGENPEIPVNEQLRNAIRTFLIWVKKHDVEFLISEQQIYSRKFNYTGTLDFICKIDGKMYIGDLKTTSGIYSEMLIQTAAYRHARVEEYPDEKYKGTLILRIDKKDGSVEPAIVDDDGWYSKMFVGFLAALKLRETLEDLKSYKPSRTIAT